MLHFLLPALSLKPALSGKPSPNAQHSSTNKLAGSVQMSQPVRSSPYNLAKTVRIKMFNGVQLSLPITKRRSKISKMPLLREHFLLMSARMPLLSSLKFHGGALIIKPLFFLNSRAILRSPEITLQAAFSLNILLRTRR